MTIMRDLGILKEMIKDSAKVKLDKRVNSTSVSVTLTEPNDPRSKVTIDGVPSNAVVIRVDLFRSPDTILNGGNKECCKRADYIIAALYNEEKYILHIEMKTQSALRHEMIAQLKGSACFIAYCREIAKYFWDEKTFLSESNIRPRFCCFVDTGSIKKRTTRARRARAEGNFTPEQFLPAYGSKQYFKYLVGA